MAMTSSPIENTTADLEFARVSSAGPTKIADIMVTINRIYSALVIIVGTIGNLYCVYVIRSTSLRKFSSSQYLLALACSDLGFLISLSLTWLSGAGIRWYHVSGVCQLANYASYVCCFLSAWYIVCLTAERCVVIYRPFYARTVASPKRARAVICLITVIGLAMNGFILILVESQPMVPTSSMDGAVSDKPLDHLDFMLDPLVRELGHSHHPHRTASPEKSDYDDNLESQWNQTQARDDRRRDLDSLSDFTDTLSPHITPLNLSVPSSDWVLINETDPRLSSPSSRRSRAVTDSSTDAAPAATPTPQLHFCLERSDTTDLYDVFNTLDMVFSFSVPLLLTFLFNIFICVRLIRASRERKHILARATGCGSLQSSSVPYAAEEMKGLSPTISFSFRVQVDQGLVKRDETCFSTVLVNKCSRRADSVSEDPSRRFSLRTNSDPAQTGLEAESGVTKPLMAAVKRHCNRLRANSLTAVMGSPSLEKERHITLFLVSISLTHLILNLPSYLFRLIQTVSVPGSSSRNGATVEDGGAIESIGISILYLLFYTQFAVNFILYSCQSGKIRNRIRRYST